MVPLDTAPSSAERLNDPDSLASDDDSVVAHTHTSKVLGSVWPYLSVLGLLGFT